MPRKKKNKFIKKIKNLSNNLGIIFLLLILGFFGGNYIKNKSEQQKKIDEIKEDILDNNSDDTDDNSNSDNTDDNTNNNSNTEEINELEVDFSLEEKPNNIIAIIGEIKKGRADSISVLTCADNFSNNYDSNWYNLTSYQNGQEIFQFNTTPKFGNRCDIPYKFKFSLDGKEKVFSFDAGFDSRIAPKLTEMESIISHYGVEGLDLEQIDKYSFKANIITKKDCENILSNLSDKSRISSLCLDPDYLIKLNKLTDNIFEFTLSENIFAGQILLNRFYDVKYNKEVFKYDSREEDEKISYKQVGDLFLSNLFNYNEKYGEIIATNKKVTADFENYYYKQNGLFFIESVDSSFKYGLKNITESEISPNIKIKDNYIAILEKIDNNKDNINEDLKIFYGEVFPGRNSIDLDFITIKAQSLGCGEIIDHNMEDYVDIVDKTIITKSSCSLELENPKFSLVD